MNVGNSSIWKDRYAMTLHALHINDHVVLEREHLEQLLAVLQSKAYQVVGPTPENHTSPKYAFIGVRSCELHAIAIQDRVFMRADFTDPTYQTRRKDLFIMAVNCGYAG